jgi:hypothetical protein
MIGYLEGSLRQLDATRALIVAGGVGYEVHIPLQTYYKLEGKPVRFGTENWKLKIENSWRFGLMRCLSFIFNFQFSIFNSEVHQ